jgi:hypothetical protein
LQREKLQWEKQRKHEETEIMEWTQQAKSFEARLRQREADLKKRELELEKEKAQLLEQYKRVKKLERQGKRREARIEDAKQHLQQQANEHFSTVYTTLQLGLKNQPASLWSPKSPVGCQIDVNAKASARCSISSKAPLPLRLTVSMDLANAPPRQRPNSTATPSPLAQTLLKFGRRHSHLSSSSQTIDVSPNVTESLAQIDDSATSLLSLLKEGKVIDTSSINHLDATSIVPSIVPQSVQQQASEVVNTSAEPVQGNDTCRRRCLALSVLKKGKMIDDSNVNYLGSAVLANTPTNMAKASLQPPLLEPPIPTMHTTPRSSTTSTLKEGKMADVCYIDYLQLSLCLQCTPCKDAPHLCRPSLPTSDDTTMAKLPPQLKPSLLEATVPTAPAISMSITCEINPLKEGKVLDNTILRSCRNCHYRQYYPRCVYCQYHRCRQYQHRGQYRYCRCHYYRQYSRTVTWKAQSLKEEKVSVKILQNSCRYSHCRQNRYRRYYLYRRYYHSRHYYLCCRLCRYKGILQPCVISLPPSDIKKPCQPRPRLDHCMIKEYIDRRHIETILYVVFLTLILVDNDATYFDEY